MVLENYVSISERKMYEKSIVLVSIPNFNYYIHTSTEHFLNNTRPLSFLKIMSLTNKDKEKKGCLGSLKNMTSAASTQTICQLASLVKTLPSQTIGRSIALRKHYKWLVVCVVGGGSQSAMVEQLLPLVF